jgi:hypothetical protein
MKKIIQACIAAITIWPIGSLAVTGGDALTDSASLSPRAIALGGASAARVDDVTALVTNPAGLGRIFSDEVALIHRLGIIDSADYLSLALPLNLGGVFGCSLFYRYLPPIDNPGATDATVISNDFLITAGYGRAFKTDPKGFEDLYLGLNLKFLHSALGPARAETAAVDIGAQWRPANLDGFQLGLAVQNLGFPVQYVDEKENLPLALQAGAALRLLKDPVNEMSLVADVNLPAETGWWKLGGGGEYWYKHFFALRVGYRYSHDSVDTGITAGAALKLPLGEEASVQLDYAYQPLFFSSQTADSEHFLSVTATF